MRLLRRRMAETVGCARDRRKPTYASGWPEGLLARHLEPFDLGELRAIGQPLAEQAEHWRHHRFDLLGSGWVRVAHGMCCRGVEGHRYDSGPTILPDKGGRWLLGRINAANVEEAMRIWQLVDDDYAPIDWHVDFKSGYRWPEDTWHGHVAIGHRPGVDVKAPWELARRCTSSFIRRGRTSRRRRVTIGCRRSWSPLPRRWCSGCRPQNGWRWNTMITASLEVPCEFVVRRCRGISRSCTAAARRFRNGISSGWKRWPSSLCT